MAITLTVNTNDTVVLGVTGTESIGLQAEPSIYIDRSTIYDGPVEFTPSGSTQTIEIAGTKALENIKINPVPSNYGLITWDGSTITVS